MSKKDKAEELGSNLIVPDEAMEEGAGLGQDPLDHDNDGEKGGSLAGEQSTAAKGAAKKKKAFVEKTWIILEENNDIPPTGLPISHNGNPYIIKPGEPVEVPNFLIEILNHAVQSGPVVNPQTGQVTGYRDRQRFPYRRVDAPQAVE